MKQQVAVMTLAVADLAIAMRFYRDGLGWKPVFANDDVTFFQCNGFVLALWVQASMEQDLQARVEPGARSCTLAHNVGTPAEVDALVDEAMRAGASLLRPPRRFEWGGYGAYFADPDGHVWEVAHNPFWEITPEGHTVFRPAS